VGAERREDAFSQVVGKVIDELGLGPRGCSAVKQGARIVKAAKIA
jgi:hypothetical protein